MKYKRSILLIPLLGLGIAESYGQQTPPPFQAKESRTSNVKYYASNYGVFGLDIKNGKSGFIVPRESDKQYVFGSGIWFGAKKQVSHDGGITFEEEKLSFICYNPNSGSSWASPGDPDWPVSGTSPILYRSSDYNGITGRPIDAGSTDPNWPLWLLPGEWTEPFYAGTFVPRGEDRMQGGTYNEPAFMRGVDEQFFSRYHDNDLERYEIGQAQAQQLGYPLGLQIQENIYSWVSSDPRQDVVILQYEVTNVSNDVLRDCHIAQVADIEIGDVANDHVMYYDVAPMLHAGIAWTEPEASQYGLLAMVMLEAPVAGTDGFVNNNNRGLYRSQGQVGTFRNWVIDIDPNTPEQRYDFIASDALDGDNGPADKRALMGSGAFHMAPGDKAYFTFAFAVLEGVTVNGTGDAKGPSPQGDAIPELEALVVELHRQYYEEGFDGGSVSSARTQHKGDAALTAAMSPNPTSESVALHLTLAERSDVQIGIVDNLGRVVRHEELTDAAAGSFTHGLNLRDLEAGSYLVSVRTGAELQSLRLNVIR